MHAKRTLFNYGKIFVITRPLPSTIPIPTLFSQPSCPTLQPTTPLTITNYPMSSKGVLNWQATRIPVGPPSPFLLSRAFPLLCTTTIDNARLFVQFLVLTIVYCSSFRSRIYTSETRSRSSQGQQEQEERCGHSRLHVRSCPSGWREEEKGETS
jgi:hypothetical protein